MPVTICLGTTMHSLGGARGTLRFTTNSPSLAIVTILRYLLISLILVAFLDGLVPCLRCAWVRRRSEHSDWIDNHAGLLVNGNLVLPEIIS